jgi:hypothetical protein
MTPPPSRKFRENSDAWSPGARIAVLAIILGAAIPLTAIATSMIGLIGLIVVWSGLVLIAAVLFGRRGK